MKEVPLGGTLILMASSTQPFVSGKTFGENGHAQRCSYLASSWHKLSTFESIPFCCLNLGNAPNDLELSLPDNVSASFPSRTLIFN